MIDSDFATHLRYVETRTPDDEWSADPDCITALLFCSAFKILKLCRQWELEHAESKDA